MLVLFNEKKKWEKTPDFYEANQFTNGRVHNLTVEEQASKNFDSQYLQNY